MSVNVSAVQSVFEAIEPLLTWVAPIAMMSIALYFIRSFFD